MLLIRKLSLIVGVVFAFSLAFPSFCSAKGYKFCDLLSLQFETNRLALRPQNESDFEVLSGYLLDQDVTKFLDPAIEKGFQTQEEALQFLKQKGSPEITSSVNLTIVLKSNNLPIGQLSAMMFGDDVVSFGYWLGKNFWGQGFASEACFLFCNKVFNADNVRFVSIYCNSENKSSCKLACKIFDCLENKNKMSFKLKKSETSNIITYNSREFVMKGLILQKMDLTDF